MTASPPRIDTEEPTIEALFSDVDLLEGNGCRTCGHRLCGHECVLAIQMGFKETPVCVGCLASGLSTTPPVFLERAVRLLLRRDCYRQAWLRASEREGEPEETRPSCLWTCGAEDATSHLEPRGRPVDSRPDIAWDAGDIGCGELALELRHRIHALEPGRVLALRATDPGAAQDIPAWCRLSGNTLLEAAHPTYRIRKREP